jgi:predicted phage terminase large subunit-like protein
MLKPEEVEEAQRQFNAREIFKRNLRAMMQACFDLEHYPKFYHEIVKTLDEKHKYTLIMVPRDHGKSTLVTISWVIQQILKNPNIRILVVNAVWDNARKFLGAIERYMDRGSKLAAVFGDFRSDNWNQDEFTVKMRTKNLVAPTVATTGIEKFQTSQHYDLIIADDLVGKGNVETPEAKRKVIEYFDTLFDLLEKPNGRMVVIGTPWAMNDLYDYIEEKKGWKVFKRNIYKNGVDGEPLYPERFTTEDIRILREQKDVYTFSSQYLLNPISEEAADFKASWIRYYASQADVPPLSYFLTADPAISLSRTADYTGMIVAGMAADRKIYVVDYVHERVVPNQLVDHVFRLVDKWKLTRIGIETIAFQLTLKYNLQEEMRRRNKFFSIEEIGRRDNQMSKEARIRRLQPYFEQGLVYLRRDMQPIVDELLSFPRGKHDDLIDALSRQLDYLVPGTASSVARGTVPGSMKEIIEKTWKSQRKGSYDYFEDLRSAKSFVS